MKLLRELEFSLSIGCRLNCRFCPQELIVNKYFQQYGKSVANMGLKDFKKILKNVEKGGIVSFSGMAEPFHNPECAKMIKYAYEEGYRICLFTTLMGMKKSDIDILKSVKLELFVLHIPDEEENCHFVMDDDYMELLQEIQEHFTPNEYSCHGTVHPQVKAYIDNHIRAGIYLGNRAGNLPEIAGSENKSDQEILCVSGFGKTTSQWSPVCLPDGTLVACCNDYGMQHIFGNLLESKWNDIQNGEAYKRFRESWKSLTDDCLCSKCAWAIPVIQLPSRRFSRFLAEDIESFSNFSKQEQQQIALLRSGRKKVIYGAGTYFKDYYQYMQWDQVLQAEVLVDQNPALWGTSILGLQCVSLKEIEKDALLIIFIKNAKPIIKELKDYGYNYVIAIADIFELAEKI